MCEQKLLVMNEYGYLSKCSQCRRYQMAFGTAFFNFTERRMKLFIANARLEQDVNIYTLSPTRKSIHLDVFYKNGAMVLSKIELDLLLDLLNEALFVESLNTIFEENNIYAS